MSISDDMPISDDELGGRLLLADRSAFSEAQRQLFDWLADAVVPWAEREGFAARTGDGRFIGPFNAALHSPVIGGRFFAFQAVEQEDTTLPPRVREVVILAVGAVWDAAYELYAHQAVGRRAGLPQEAVRELAAGRLPVGLSAAEQCAWQFASQLTAGRRVEQPVYDQACAVFGTRGVADLVFLIGAYQTVCGILNAFEIPAPQASGDR
jgi:4-carboxymuconolactone decarboxylase